MGQFKQTHGLIRRLFPLVIGLALLAIVLMDRNLKPQRLQAAFGSPLPTATAGSFCQ